MIREIQHLIDQMTDDERRQYLVRKPVPQLRLVRERAARRLREEADARKLSARSVSLNYLATRFTCSWPWSTMVLLCDGRIVCGCADPVRQACARRHADRRRSSAIWTGERASDAAARPERRRIEVLRRLPAQAAAQEGRAAAAAAARRRRRCRRGCTSSARRPATSRAPRRAARRRPASPARARPACSTSICSRASSTRPAPSLGAHRLLQLRRGLPAQARASRCASTSSRATRTSISTPAPTGWRFTEDAVAPAGALGHRRGDLLDRRRDRRTATRQYRQRGDFDKAIRNLRARWPTRSSAPAATCRSSTGATSSSRTTTATRRWRWRGSMAAEIGVDRLCWELTDHPEDMFSRRFAPGTPELARDPARDLGRQQPRQRHPGRDAARATSTSAASVARTAGDRRVAGRAGCRSTHDASPTCSTRPFAAQASYGRRLVRLGAQLCRRGRRRSSTATSSAPGCRQTLQPGRVDGGPDHDHGAARARTLPAEVRSWSARGSTGSKRADRRRRRRRWW